MGRDDWLAELYDEDKRLLLLVAFNFVSQREAAEDVLHAAIVKLAQLPTPPTSPRSYAIRTVRNMAIDLLRKQRHVSEEPWDDVPQSNTTQGTDSNEREERMLAIQRALLQLSPESRELIQLHLQGGLTFREIGEAIGEPTQTVASRYRRSINKLRSIVEVNHE